MFHYSAIRQGTLSVRTLCLRTPSLSFGREVQDIIQNPKYILDAKRIEDDNGSGMVCRHGVPWYLDRISRDRPMPANADPEKLSYTYRMQAPPTHKPVNVYVVDTGIMLNHEQFPNNRAVLGWNFTSEVDGDADGHGTHVAAIIGGRDFGVATGDNLKIVSVQVADGDDTLAHITWGMEWIMAHARATGIPGVVNISLRFTFQAKRFDLLEQAMKDAVACGLYVVVAAGNETSDARTVTPARIPDTLAVGASTINDECANFSNYGPRVGIFAAGKCIISAAIASPSSSIPKSGTSMVAPVVAGTIAYLIQKEGNRTPKATIARLQELAHHGALVGNLPYGTRNLLVNNGIRRLG